MSRTTGIRHFGLVLTSVALMAALAACGGDPTAAPTATTAPTAAPTAAPTTAPAPTQPSSGGQQPAPTRAPTQAPTPTPTPISLAGKTIRFTVGFAPGGSFDIGARLVAKHLPQYLPGKPRTVTSNLAGGGSLSAARRVLESTPRENEPEVAVFIVSVLLRSALGQVEGFDPTKAAYLGVPDLGVRDTSMCARTEVADSLEKFLASTKKLTVPGLDGTSSTDIDLKWAEMVGLPIQPVFGYSGMTEFRAAIDRGEMELASPCTDIDATQFPHWVSENYVTPLFRFADGTPEWIKQGMDQGKWPWFTNIRDIPQVKQNATPAQTQAIDFFHDFTSFTSGGQVYAMSPDVPAPVLNTIRAGFAQVVNSQAFKDDLAKQGFTAGLMKGEDLQGLVEKSSKLSPDVLAVLNQLFKAR